MGFLTAHFSLVSNFFLSNFFLFLNNLLCRQPTFPYFKISVQVTRTQGGGAIVTLI